MSKMLINISRERGQLHEVRVAIVNDDLKLTFLDIERPSIKQNKSNIYKGTISSIEPSLGAVFVNYGMERHGFLPLKEISHEYFLGQADKPNNEVDLTKALKEGQEVVVQVDKEERGTKGAALTTYISLAGSYLVLMPNNPRAGGVSRRIEGEERDQLKQALSQLKIPEGMGVIIRTAGISKSLEELQWDLDMLLNYWNAVKQAAIAKSGPYLIHQESNATLRAIRDYLRHDVEVVVVDDEQEFNTIRDYLSQIRPDFAERVKHYDDPMPLFSRYRVEQQIEQAYQREVRLPSGGSLVIDQTEALVSIDINSASATRGNNIEETALNTNLEAAEEIARQLRLRDIGGLIVIDFIDMSPTQHQRDVEDRLRKALSPDRARTQVGRISSRFGLLEMSRQRLRATIGNASNNLCPVCNGRGLVRDAESLGLSILHTIEERAAREKSVQFVIQAPVNVATLLMNEKRDMIHDIEKKHDVDVVIVPNQYFHGHQFEIDSVKVSHRNSKRSYEMASQPQNEIEAKRRTESQEVNSDEPAINKYLTQDTADKPRPGKTPKAKKPGLLVRIFKAIFGSSKAKKHKGKQHGKPHDRRHRQHSRQQRNGSRSNNNNRRHGNRSNDRNRNNNNRGGNGGNRQRSNNRSGNNQGNRNNNQQPRQEREPRPADQQKPQQTQPKPDVANKPAQKPARPQQAPKPAPAAVQQQAPKPELNLPPAPKQATEPRKRTRFVASDAPQNKTEG